MQKILVVEDGTQTSVLIYQLLKKQLSICECEAEPRLLSIRRDSESGLSHGERIREYRGDPLHLAEEIGDTTILLVHLSPVSTETIKSAPNLRLIGTARSSVPNIDTKYAAVRNIPIIYCPGRNAQTVAEFTFGLLLDLLRSISKAHSLVIEGRWSKDMNRQAFSGIELQGKTLGIIGFGEIGQAVSIIALGFGMDVLYFDPLVGKEGANIKKVSLEELLRQSDIVSVNAKGFQDKPLVGHDEFKKMKQGAYLVNTSRGSLIDEQALIEYLRNGYLSGAALDVFHIEPLPPESPLLYLSNVILAPHIAGLSKDMAERGASMLVEDTLHFLKGDNPKRIYKEN